MALGYDADFTIVDLKAKRMIRNEDQATRAGWTPFDGMEAKGWPNGHDHPRPSGDCVTARW